MEGGRWAQSVGQPLTSNPSRGSILDCFFEVHAAKPQNFALPSVNASKNEGASLPTPRTPLATPRSPTATPRAFSDEDEFRYRRTEFFVYDLLMEMNFEHIVDMKRAFAEGGGGVSVVDFVKIMKNAIPHMKEDERKIISKLTELFAEIDIDGDEEMTWDEFTSFIIKSGLEPYDPSSSVKKYQEVTLQNKIHFNSLTKLKYVPQIDRLVVLDNSFSQVKEKVIRLFKPEPVGLQTEYFVTKEIKLTTAGWGTSCEFIDPKR
jgi:hypothetical protein